MSTPLAVAAIVIAFLLGGLVVAEFFCRREDARRGMQWADNRPAPRETIYSQADESAE